MNLFSDAEKLELENVMTDVHDSFSRPVVLIKEAEKTFVSTEINNYVYLYEQNQPSVNLSKVQVSGTYQARIKYINNIDLNFVTEGRGDEDANRLPITQDKNLIRLKLPMEAYNFFKDVEQIQFDSGYFKQFTSPKLHGIFTPQYFDIHLQEVQ